ncbi:MAG: aspartyl protease [SAR202 cluster bacterium]|nr:aspartyl protease [SAR202 cluster bacterium]
MGVTYIEGTARGPSGREAPARFLVDSGATYSLLPTEVWQQLGLEPTREHTFALAGGTMIRRQISRYYLVLPQGEDYTAVILGEPGDEALLGVVTLEILGLVLNPFSRTLHPMRMLLA